MPAGLRLARVPAADGGAGGIAGVEHLVVGEEVDAGAVEGTAHPGAEADDAGERLVVPQCAERLRRPAAGTAQEIARGAGLAGGAEEGPAVGQRVVVQAAVAAGRAGVSGRAPRAEQRHT